MTAALESSSYQVLGKPGGPTGDGHRMRTSHLNSQEAAR